MKAIIVGDLRSSPNIISILYWPFCEHFCHINTHFPHGFTLWLIWLSQYFIEQLFVFAGVWSGVEHQGQRFLPQHLRTSSAQILRRLQSLCEDYRQGDDRSTSFLLNIDLVTLATTRYKVHLSHQAKSTIATASLSARWMHTRKNLLDPLNNGLKAVVWP